MAALTSQQLEFLRALCCDAAQSHLFGKPVAPDKLTKWMLTNPIFAGVPSAGQHVCA